MRFWLCFRNLLGRRPARQDRRECSNPWGPAMPCEESPDPRWDKVYGVGIQSPRRQGNLVRWKSSSIWRTSRSISVPFFNCARSCMSTGHVYSCLSACSSRDCGCLIATVTVTQTPLCNLLHQCTLSHANRDTHEFHGVDRSTPRNAIVVPLTLVYCEHCPRGAHCNATTSDLRAPFGMGQGHHLPVAQCTSW